ncbi:hypothetical protein BTO06_12090 [Tenacibaculum sp. SZ-18]|uniref:MltR family transcriptional regulator n=1 Tax=Tenacibaculum sp. SZ-18 TaxID=754423 RepID=UPI000C2D3523|nr:MltR family transcriptional regulator [Tenacibaculum sp. SZ-18]AUC15844.1 hypothetical protein BTO06_12090 [Tenacibaculum sp. SZ-18]
MNKKQTEPEIKELGKFFSTIQGESDRGTVLLVASILDEWLFEILKSYLIQDKVSEDLLSGFAAPLGTFSSRIKACYSLSLIEKEEFDLIEVIRKIRNEFGHNWQDISFKSPKIKGQLDKLSWYGPEDIDESSRTDRSKFDFAATNILVNLIWRKRLVAKERIQMRIWPNKS